jgi:predicted DNA-binding protein
MTTKQYNSSKISTAVYLSPVMSQRIDDARGLVKKSTYIENIIERYMNKKEI